MINKKVILNEGGNVEIDDIAAQRIDLTKISRTEMVNEIDKALKVANAAFNKMYGVPLWSPKLIDNKEFLSGSAFHFFNLKIPDLEFVKFKPTVGDIDTMVDKDLGEKAKEFLTKYKGKKFGPATLIGFKPNPGQDTLISLWGFADPAVNVQIDLELVDYAKGSPTDWSKFSHSSAWEDLSVGIKGVFHKYLLRSLTHKDAKDRYIQMKTKLKKVTSSDLAFAVTGGVRRKYEPVIDPKTKKPAVAVDGIGIFKEIPASESEYVNDIKGMFTLLIGRKPAKGEEKYLGSFVGLLSLINKYFTAEDKSKITQAFIELLFGSAAQQLYKGDPATDKREKEIALKKLIEILKVKVDQKTLATTTANFYSKYKTESITEADAPDYKRQGIKHIYNPGSTVEMKDVDFLAFVDAIAKNGGTLDNIPITLKVDGAGIRFGRDQSGKPFFMTSRVTNPIYADQIGMFEKYARDNNGNEEQVARAEKYDQALNLIVNSDFIKILPKDTIVQAEMMFNAMAQKTDQGLKFVNISYDPKKLGKQMTLVPIVASTYSTGEVLPNTILEKLVKKSTPQIKILSTKLEHSEIDVKNIVAPIAKMDDVLRAALTSKKKNDPNKAKAKEILTQARKAISNAIINSPNIKGKDKLGDTIEGLVIAMPNGQLAKVTSTEMQGAMAAKAIKKAPTTGGNRTKAAVVTAGSFVGHIGHQKVIDEVIRAAKKLGGDPYVYISSKVGPDDPIPPEVKVATWKKLYPNYANIFQLIVSPDGVTVPNPMKKIEKELVLPANSPYKKIVLMVGTDRYAGFKKWMDTLEKRMKDPVALAKYGGTQDQVSFDTIAIPRGAELGGIDASFTALRNVLKDPNLNLSQKLEAWKKGFGNKLDDDWIKKLMMLTAKGMGVNLGKEKVAEEVNDLNVRFHDRLNPALFTSQKTMSPVVREKLLQIADDFKDSLGVKLPNLKDITVSGSNAAYAYTPKSDIDLHLVVDIPDVDNDQTWRELFDAKKFQYNEQHDFKIKGYDVELYVQNANEEHISQGIYSVMNDAWIREPQKVDAEWDEVSTRAKYDQLKYLILKAASVRDYNLADKLRKTIKKYRQVGLHSTGEFGPENLAFKALRANGYLKKLYDLLNDIKDKEFSLESHDQRLLEIDMSPGALKQFSASAIAKSASVGFEFEMIVPYMSDPDAGDGQADYANYDDAVSSGSLGSLEDDLRSFFSETTTRREVQRAVEDFSERLNEYIDQQFDDWLKENQDMFYEMYRDWTNLETDEEIQASIEAEDADYDRIVEKMRDQHREEWDDLEGALRENDLEMYSDWEREYGFPWPYYEEERSGEIDADAMKDVADEIKRAVNMPIKSSPNYHAFSKREPGVWYLETDSSIDADESEGEGGLELISPPMPLDQALEKLDAVLNWMEDHGAYTDSSTGFHMGVSIPEMEKVDYIKLILFLGDRYVLDQFGRLGNSYTRSALSKMEIGNAPSVMRSMPGIFDALKGGLDKAALKMIEAMLVPRGDKYTSVNIKTGYIEFRSAGGNYLEAIEKIKNTLLRYVRVMAIAADPNDAKQEYAKKLYKLLATAAANEKDLDVIKWFTMYSSGNLAKAELVSKLKQAQARRKVLKVLDTSWTLIGMYDRPITVVQAKTQDEAWAKGREWEKSNPVNGGLRGIRRSTEDDIQQLTAASISEPAGPWQRWIVYGAGDDGRNVPLTAVSARDRQEASRLAFRWGRDNNRVVTGLEPEDEDVSNLANMIHRNESKEIVTELANKPYPYKVEDSFGDEFIAKFKTEKGMIYRVRIDPDFENPNSVGVSFEAILTKDYSEKTSAKTNTGDAFRVFATVGNILKIYLQKKPKVIQFYFSGDAKEPSRLKLYDSMSKIIPKFLSNWKLVNIDKDEYANYYHFAKVNTNESQLTELANKPYPYDNVTTKHDANFTKYVFTSENGLNYKVSLIVEHDDYGEPTNKVSIEFAAFKNMRYTQYVLNTGDAFRVFATVAAIVKDYLRSRPEITRLEFSADKDEPSRVKLYSAMAKMMPKFLPGWKLADVEDGYSYHHFQFVKLREGTLSSLKEYIEVSDRPFIWQKDEPKKELTEMQKACILGGQEYTGEIN